MQRSLWFLIPASKPGGTHANGAGLPVVFLSAEKMSAWLGSRSGENYWYVRLLNRDSAVKVLNELRSDQGSEILADLDGSPPQKIATADLVVRLQGG